MLEDCKNDFKEQEVSSSLDDKSIQGNASNISSLSSQLSSAIQISESHIQDLTTNMLSNSTNSLLDQSMQSMLISSNESKNDMPLTFSNLNVITTESSDKIWSLIDSANNDEFANKSYMDNMNPNIYPFSDQSLMQKAQSHSTQPQIKRAITGASGNYNQQSPQTIASNRNQMPNSAMYNNSKNAAALNWHTNAPTATSMSSNLTWSNSFNSTLPSCLNTFASTSTSNSIQNAWPTNACNNVNNNSSKRPPIGSSSINPSKKSIYSSDQNQSALPVNSVLSPSKFRRNPAISTFKNFTNSNIAGQSNLYDLGSAGSDNTSSSSDSANLRDNGLLHLQQERNADSQFNPLETLRYSLEPQLLEIVRNNGTQDNKQFNFPYQGVSQDDKKHIKGRNFSRRRGKSPFFTGSDSDNLLADFSPSNNEHVERFSRKVFVGGLPPDIDEEEITASFRRFGSLVVDWPHKAESKSYFPPKGYAFLLFQEETSVQMLIDVCIAEEDKLYLCVSSPTIKDKPVQIRPWRLSDADYVLDASMPLDPRKTVFVGGVPRPLKAVELAMIMDRLYGGVCYAGIDTDPELKYPKGAGRVAFSNQQSYIAAISARFVQLQHADIEKRVEVKPYVLDDQICDECQGTRCGGKFAPYFCANITCLQYYCENCWATIHSRPGREFHKPLVKEGADRPRAVPFRWC